MLSGLHTLHPALICSVLNFSWDWPSNLCGSFCGVSLAPRGCLHPSASDAKGFHKDTMRGCSVIVSMVDIRQSFATSLQEVEHLMSLPAQIHAMVQQGVPWWQIIYTGIMSTDAVLMIEVRALAPFAPHLLSAPCLHSRTTCDGQLHSSPYLGLMKRFMHAAHMPVHSPAEVLQVVTSGMRTKPTFTARTGL